MMSHIGILFSGNTDKFRLQVSIDLVVLLLAQVMPIPKPSGFSDDDAYKM
jgi:hypothetical protein